MSAEMSDAALAQRVAEGDREAEAEVCRRMGPRIRLYGLRHLRLRLPLTISSSRCS